MPPVQRVLGTHPLVNPPQDFAAGLTTRQTTGFLSPLGHAVTPEAPSGVVEAVPVRGGDVSDLPVVQAVPPAAATQNTPMVQRWSDSSPTPVLRSVSPVSADSGGPGSVETPEPRSLPVVEAAPVAALPEPLPAPVPDPEPAAAEPDPVAATAPESPTLGSSGDTVTSVQASSGATPVGAPMVQRSTDAPAMPLVDAPAATPARRRGGLGPPMISSAADMTPAPLPPAVTEQIAAPASPRSLPVGQTLSRIADGQAPTLGAATTVPLDAGGATETPTTTDATPSAAMPMAVAPTPPAPMVSRLATDGESFPTATVSRGTDPASASSPTSFDAPTLGTADLPAAAPAAASSVSSGTSASTSPMVQRSTSAPTTTPSSPGTPSASSASGLPVVSSPQGSTSARLSAAFSEAVPGPGAAHPPPTSDSRETPGVGGEWSEPSPVDNPPVVDNSDLPTVTAQLVGDRQLATNSPTDGAGFDGESPGNGNDLGPGDSGPTAPGTESPALPLVSGSPSASSTPSVQRMTPTLGTMPTGGTSEASTSSAVTVSRSTTPPPAMPTVQTVPTLGAPRTSPTGGPSAISAPGSANGHAGGWGSTASIGTSSHLSPTSSIMTLPVPGAAHPPPTSDGRGAPGVGGEWSEPSPVDNPPVVDNFDAPVVSRFANGSVGRSRGSATRTNGALTPAYLQRTTAPGASPFPMAAGTAASAMPMAAVIPPPLPPPTLVQRVEEAAPPPEPPPAAAPAESAPAATTSAPAAAAPAAGAEPTELLAKLYDPLLRKLRAELRIDRERRGALTDLWH